MKKYKNYIFIFILFILFFAITYSFKYFNLKKDYVLKINDEYIYKNEFLLYLNEQERIFEEIGGIDIWQTDFDGMPAKDVAKNNTINSIIFLKAVVYEAKNLGISLTKDEEEYCKEEAIKLKQNFNLSNNIEIPLNIYEKFIKENLIEEKVYRYITDNFIVDENDFKKYFENYIKQNFNELNKINLDYIFIENNNTFDAKQKAQQLQNSITLNTNFKDIKEEPFIKIYQNIELEKGMFEKNIEDKIYKLSDKSISNSIEGRDGFYIFKINEILKPNMQDVENLVKEEYIQIKKSEIYNMQTKNWVNNLTIKKNNEILSNI